MTWTRILTGSLSILIGSVMVVYSIPISTLSGLEVTAPKIQDISHSSEGNVWSITCTVYPGALGDETMVYWLANNTFVETVYKNGRVQTKQSVVGTNCIETTLVVSKVVEEDFLTKFSCIALNPAGFDMKTTELKSCK